MPRHRGTPPAVRRVRSGFIGTATFAPAFMLRARTARRRFYADSGNSWSEMDFEDLRQSLDYGDTLAETASFLCRDEDEVSDKMKELGLVEQSDKWKARKRKVAR
jgi:hypothetical protein